MEVYNSLSYKNLLYAPSVMYSLISRRKARQNGFKTEIDDWNKDPSRGLMQITEMKSGIARKIDIKTQEGLYEAWVRPVAVKRCVLTQKILSNLWHYRKRQTSKNVHKSTILVINGVKLNKMSNHMDQCSSCQTKESIRQPVTVVLKSRIINMLSVHLNGYIQMWFYQSKRRSWVAPNIL